MITVTSDEVFAAAKFQSGLYRQHEVALSIEEEKPRCNINFIPDDFWEIPFHFFPFSFLGFTNFFSFSLNAGSDSSHLS